MEEVGGDQRRREASAARAGKALDDWEVVESPSLEIFKTRLDKVLCRLL